MKSASIPFPFLISLLLAASGVNLAAQGSLTIDTLEKDFHALLDTGTAVVAADRGGSIVRSTDAGENFALRLAGDPDEPFFALAKAGDTLIAGGRNGVIFRSEDDGLNWTEAQVEPIFGDLEAVAGNGAGRWIAVGSGHEKPAVFVSNDDGKTWNVESVGAGAIELFGIVWHSESGQFVAVGGDGFFEARALTSESGVSWSTVNTVPIGARQLRFIATDSAGRLLAGGDNGTLIRTGGGSSLAFVDVPGGGVSERLTAGVSLEIDDDWVVGGASKILIRVHADGAAILSQPEPLAQTVEALLFLAPETILVAGAFSGEPRTEPVRPVPQVISPPQSVDLFEEDDATFSVSVEGIGITIQWERSINAGQTWAPIPGANALGYTAENVTLSMSGDYYRVLVTNSSGSEISESATLTVNQRIAPRESRFIEGITGFEGAGYLFLSDGKFRRRDSAGNWVEGEWYFVRSETDSSRATLTFIDGEGNPNPVVKTLFLTFENPESAVYSLEPGGPATGRISLDFDFFGIERLPGSPSRESIWFGRFDDRHFDHETTRVGWIKHEEHDWLYAAGKGFGEGIWFWDAIQGDWLWTRQDLYPFLFSHGRQQWAYYQTGGVPQARKFQFYDNETNQWTEVEYP